MIWHNATAEEALNTLEVSPDTGLTSCEAAERLSEYGKNTSIAGEQPRLLRRFFEQLNNKAAIALIIISLISFGTSLIYKEGDIASPFLIIALVIVNALAGAYHIYGSERAKNRLGGISSPDATVLREGKIRRVPSELLVPGDILVLSQGDYINADARIIEATELRCNESPLTGETVPVEKRHDCILEDITASEHRSNMVFCGCTVVHGTAKAVVTATGLSTEAGHNTVIAREIGDERLPFEASLDRTSKIINTVVLICCIIFFFIGMLRSFRNTAPFASTTVNMLVNTAALAVAAIPEGLSAISAVVIALGIQRIVKDRIIIKKAGAVELLGRTGVICADKTGILTHNSMKVKCIYDGNRIINPEDEASDERCSLILKLAASCSTLTNDSTEAAIKRACLEFAAMSENDLANQLPRLSKIPFDPQRKTMTTINMIDGKPFAIVKGATELLIKKCIECDSDKILACNDMLARDGMRIVCLAMKPLEEIPANPEAEYIENGLVFVGLIGLYDPPRSSAVKALEACESAGIKTIMITGDHPLTAAAIARRIGILRDGTELICGSELEKLSDSELAESIKKYSVFARISPEDKVRIVRAWQANGETVTITGDGIEDADALTLADVGCAVGKNGTDVARGCADIIIANNGFSSVIAAIKESRGLFDNIRKSVYYLFSSNFGELLLFLIAMLFSKGAAVPLSAIQLLLVNLLTDTAPAVSLSLEKAENEVMSRRYIRTDRMFDFKSVISITVEAVFIAAMALTAFFSGSDEYVAATSCFTTLTAIQLFHIFNIRASVSAFSSIKRIYCENRFLVISSICIFLTIILLAVSPIGIIFGLHTIGIGRFAFCILLAFSVIPFCELKKLIFRKIF